MALVINDRPINAATAAQPQGREINLIEKGNLVKYLWDEVNNGTYTLDEVPTIG